MTDTAQPNEQANTRWRSLTWPAIVVLLLGGHVFLITGALLLSSTWIPGASTAPAGYAEALKWDDLKALRQASERLGWTLEVIPTDQTELNGDRRVEFVLRDRTGELVEGAELTVTLYHLSRPKDVIDQKLAASAQTPGRYEATMELDREGVWRLNAIADRGADRFLVEADLWVAPPKETAS